jgi:hypothetical protein
MKKNFLDILVSLIESMLPILKLVPRSLLFLEMHVPEVDKVLIFKRLIGGYAGVRKSTQRHTGVQIRHWYTHTYLQLQYLPRCLAR